MTSYKIIGDYKYNNDEWLGTGSFATVYKGYHVITNKVVAIKVINIRKLEKEHDSERIMICLKSEIDTMKKLNHINILKLEDVTFDASNIYMILEYCNGGDLLSYIKIRTRGKKNTGIGEKDTKIIALQLADGLRHMHSFGIVHRDLKPQNILLNKISDNNDTNMIIKIADFGFAKVLESTQMAQTICGSPLYMAPEVLSMQSYTNKADLWSFGTILYEMMTGLPPIQANSAMELCDKQKAIKQIKLPTNITASLEFRNLISSLLTINSTTRITWEQFLEHKWLDNAIDISQDHVTTCDIGSAPARVQHSFDRNKNLSHDILSGQQNSFKVPALDLLKSFVIVDKNLQEEKHREFAVVGSENDILQELQKWVDIIETLCETGKYKISINHHVEGGNIFEHCMKIGSIILELVDKYLQQNKKITGNLQPTHSADQIKDTKNNPIDDMAKSECVSVQHVLDFSATHTKMEILTVRMSKNLKICEMLLEQCNKIILEKDLKCSKPIIRLLCDTAVSLEKQGSMEVKIDEFSRAKCHFTCAKHLFESIIPFSDGTDKTSLVKHITVLDKRIQYVNKLVTM